MGLYIRLSCIVFNLGTSLYDMAFTTATTFIGQCEAIVAYVVKWDTVTRNPNRSLATT